jgi:serine/threonine protein phosphatase 1
MITRIPGVPMVRRLPANRLGRDFMVTDIHGCYSLLEHLLKRVGFDENRDRLFIIGDLVDRGPENHRAIEWLQKPFVHVIRGNHDQMLLDAAQNGYDYNHENNGGEWYIEMMRDNPELAQEFEQHFSGLPFAIEVESLDGQRFGLVHGECPLFDWNDFTHALEHEEDPKRLHNIVIAAIWMRSRIELGDVTPITGIDTVFVGHSVVEEVGQLGNTVYLDTGAVFRDGKMTVMQMDNRQTWSMTRKQLMAIRMHERDNVELS